VAIAAATALVGTGCGAARERLPRGRFADACRLATPGQRAKLAAATHASCPAALDVVRKAVGITALARDEQQIDDLPITVSSDAAGETSHYVYTGGRWRIGSAA